MHVLVTGGAGFIGSNLVKKLAGDGHEVVAVDDFSSASWTNLVEFKGDVLTIDVAGVLSWLETAKPFDVILHQASITDTTVTDQRHMMHNNHDGFRQILELAAKWKARMVWASSASIYGQNPAPNKESQPPQPLNVYAFSKLAMERLAAQYQGKLAHPIVGLRYFNVYGPGESHKGKFASMINQLAKQMKSGNRPRLFEFGEQKRDFVYIDDVMQANFKAMSTKTGGVFNVGSGRAETFNRIVAVLNKVMKFDLQPDYFKNPYSFTQDWTQADLTESKKGIGYEPNFDLDKGIAAYHATGKLGA